MGTAINHNNNLYLNQAKAHTHRHTQHARIHETQYTIKEETMKL